MARAAQQRTSKVTFTVDLETVREINHAAEILSKPKSQIVREAVSEYHKRIGKLSDSERLRMLKLYDELISRIPKRSEASMEAELAELRNARKPGGRGGISGFRP